MDITRSPSKIRTTRKTITFTGAAGVGEAGTAVTVYSVVGNIYLHALICYCTTLLTESGATATVSLGTASQVTRFIGNTNSVEIDANEIWVSTTPTVGSIDLPDAMQSVVITNGDDIIVNPLTTNTTGGVLQFVMFWEPVSTDGTAS